MQSVDEIIDQLNQDGIDETHEVAKEWSHNFANKILAIIDEEIDEINDTISNERLWEKGFEPTPENDLNFHTCNIAEQRFYKKQVELMRIMIAGINDLVDES